jgi:hypothetical protein
MSERSIFPEAQSSLSLGYIYLILLGILNETLYYDQLGIEILKYSNVLDVLLSPISKLFSGNGFYVLFAFILITIFLPKYLLSQRHKKWFKKSFSLDEKLSDHEVKNSFFKSIIFIGAIGIFGFFIGTGLGGGHRIVDKIENNELNYNDKITFVNGEVYLVTLIGKNSSYIFYLTEGSSTTKVTPINGVVKSIEEVI